jgi:hypothetical protein
LFGRDQPARNPTGSVFLKSGRRFEKYTETVEVEFTIRVRVVTTHSDCALQHTLCAAVFRWLALQKIQG